MRKIFPGTKNTQSAKYENLTIFVQARVIANSCRNSATVALCLMNVIRLYTVSQKLDPFLFEHNFDKYCPILVILSLLQTEINCNNVYHKMHHHTSNLLVYYLVK